MKLLVVGLILVIALLIVWVVWGEVIAGRMRKQRILDDEGLRER